MDEAKKNALLETAGFAGGRGCKVLVQRLLEDKEQFCQEWNAAHEEKAETCKSAWQLLFKPLLTDCGRAYAPAAGIGMFDFLAAVEALAQQYGSDFDAEDLLDLGASDGIEGWGRAVDEELSEEGWRLAAAGLDGGALALVLVRAAELPGLKALAASCGEHIRTFAA